MANQNNSSPRNRQSAMKNNAKIRKIVEASSSINKTQNQSDQLVVFSKYAILPPELRHYALTYSRRTTLKNYAEVSRLCNEETQKFNTSAPQVVKYTKTEGAVEIELQYKRSTISKSFASKNDAGNAEIVRWIEKKYQYVRDHNTKKISIVSREWPNYITDMRYFNQVNHLTVTYRRRMTGKIMEFIEKRPLIKLELLENDTASEEVVPRRFFKETNLQKITEMINIQPSCNMDNDQFMALEPIHLNIQPVIITGQMIEAKISTMISGTCKCRKFSVKVSNWRLFMFRDYCFTYQPPHDPGLRVLESHGRKGTLRWFSRS